MATQNIEELVMCAITHQRMIDPVTGPDGHTYERSAILEWLVTNGTSPMTREPMTAADLVDAVTVRQIIDQLDPIAGTPGMSALPASPPIASIQHKDQDSEVMDMNTSVHVCDDKLRFTASIEDRPERLNKGQDIVAVFDRSGSMGSSVEAKDPSGKNIESGFSVMDLTKHSVKTIIHTLRNGDGIRSGDRFAMVIFDDRIETLYELMPIANPQSIVKRIEMVEPRSQTNIWGGIVRAMEILDNRTNKNRNACILLFTDGIPNMSPAKGEAAALKSKIKTTNFVYPVHTFGFGYNLQPSLLPDISRNGIGMQCFIPDGTMMGTVFVNGIGNILATVATKLVLHVEDPSNVIKSILGDYPESRTFKDGGKSISIDMGTLQFAQSKDIVIEVQMDRINGMRRDQPFGEYHWTYFENGVEKQTPPQSLVFNALYDDATGETTYQFLRQKSIDTLNTCVKQNKNVGCLPKSEALLDKLKQELSSNADSVPDGEARQKIRGLLDTVEDQVTLALTDFSHFERWGRFYVESCIASLRNQMRQNFKDAMTQVFGGAEFESFTEKANEVFDNLPPPKASNKNSQTQAVRSMATYNNHSNPCFDGECTILMGDKTERKLNQLRKGDVISTPEGNATIVCLLETKCRNGFAELVKFGDLHVTPWHPIIKDTKWVFPTNAGIVKKRACDSVFSLILDRVHMAYVAGYCVICLGHNYTEGILKHEYFGSNRVIDDLKEMPGWNEGHIILNSGCLRATKGRVEEIVYNGEQLKGL